MVIILVGCWKISGAFRTLVKVKVGVVGGLLVRAT